MQLQLQLAKCVAVAIKRWLLRWLFERTVDSDCECDSVRLS